MSKRPHSITAIGWLFIAVGVVGSVYHATDFSFQHPFDDDGLWVILVRLLAILFGVFLLRGRNWARWAIVLWLGYHVVLSIGHDTSELIVHGLLLAAIGSLLYSPKANAYVREPATASATDAQKK